MNSSRPGFFQELNRIVPLWAVLAAFVLYALGSGIAVYQGDPLRLETYIPGQIMVLCLLAAAFFLDEYFTRLGDPRERPASPLQRSGALLLLSATVLTIGALVSVLLVARDEFSPGAYIFSGIGLLLSLAYGIPPLSLARKGYGEIILAILLANVAPGLGLILQNGEYHRMLAQLTFPLALLALAAQTAMRFPSYAADLKNEDQNLVTRLGWQRAVMLHNLLLLFAFLLFGFAGLNALPWSITWPALLTLPVAVLQFWLMQGIAQGSKPRWKLLLITALCTFLLSAYFITLALFTS